MSAAGYALLRLRSLHEARGWLGLARFLATRLARTQSDVVFECALAEDETEAPVFDPGRRMVVIDQRNLGDRALQPVLAQLFVGESAAYRPGLERGDIALAVVDDHGFVLHRSFIQFETRYKSILGETIEVPLIANCLTVPSARGERLYPRTLRHAASLLARLGYGRVIITCEAANASSISGILRAGFKESRAIASMVILFRLVVQRISRSDGRTNRRVVWI